MGEDCHCADQTRYVCGNSVDDPVLDIWGVADSLVPQEKSTVTFTKPIRSIGEKPHYTQNWLAKGRESSSVNEKKAESFGCHGAQNARAGLFCGHVQEHSFEQCNLAGVIDRMLRCALEEAVEGVGPTWHNGFEPLVRESFDCLNQLQMLREK